MNKETNFIYNDEEAIIENQIKSIGTKIAKIRKEKGLSLQKLSELTGISKNQLSRMERSYIRRISVEALLKIAYVLNIDVTYFFQDFTSPITDGDVFNEITDTMEEKERRCMLEIVRNCKSLMLEARKR